MLTISLFLTGLLAGEELVVRYGVRDPLGALDPVAQLHLRQALIRRLRVLVPAIMLPAVVTSIAAAVMQPAPLRWAALGALGLFLVVTLGGTVPINQAVLTWSHHTLPDGWREVVRRWERLDTVRCWAALTAFACQLASR